MATKDKAENPQIPVGIAKVAEPIISLQEFCMTDGAPIEMRGGFLYQMQIEGKTRATRSEYKAMLKAFGSRIVL